MSGLGAGRSRERNMVLAILGLASSCERRPETSQEEFSVVGKAKQGWGGRAGWAQEAMAEGERPGEAGRRGGR